MYQSYSSSYVSYLLYECHSYFIFKPFLIFSGLVKLLLISTPSLLIQMFYSAFLILQIIPMIINQPLLFIIAFNWNRCKLLSGKFAYTHIPHTLPIYISKYFYHPALHRHHTPSFMLSIDITLLLFPRSYTN